MLHGKNPRLDGRRTASSYCSTLTIVVFVALCLIGVWMMTSSALIPFGNLNLLVPGDANGQIIKKDSLQFEDQPRVSEEIDKEIAENVQEDNFDKESQRGNNFLDDNQSENKEGKKEGRDREEWSVTDDEQEAKKDFHENLTEYQSEQSSASEKKGHVEEKVDESQERRSENNPGEVFPYGTELEFFNDTNTKNGSWSTQDIESKNEKKRRESSSSKTLADASKYSYSWKICNSSAGPDYIPCLDNEEVIRKLPSTKHYEHRERHCPDEPPTCLTPLPEGYKQSIKWPQSRDQVWYSNVPHTKLAEVKGHQNWVKVTGEYLTFPGGGTQFKHGALHYIDFIQEMMPNIMWGKKSRVLLDVGCGVASFGGYLFERDVLAMSFAPKDEHEAQVQFALERGIPAISSVMGTKRLPFPSKVFDVVHCARCCVPWHVEGGMLLLELNRLLRPGGYFIWSATPIYQKLPEDVEIWKAMSSLTKSICWKMISVKRDTLNQVGIAIFQKPNSNKCYDQRTKNNPSLCPEYDDPDAAWNVSLQACMHRVPTKESLRGSKWPEHWPARLDKVPYWLNASQTGVYGKAAPEDFIQDYQNWKRIVQNSYLKGMGINWSNVRNVMDMRSIYGGFAAAMREMNVWVMNVVPIDSADTLSIIYERGLFGIYHDWCESFSTYPRTYDLLHADHLFSKSQKRCKLEAVMAEADRILRPKGNLIVRDSVDIIGKIKDIAKSLHWEVQFIYSKQKEGLLCVQKTTWRPQLFDLSS